MARKPRLLKLAPIETPPAPTLATKVTGHNLSNITYLVSLAAERGGYEFEFRAKFLTDGSLYYVEVPRVMLTSDASRSYRVYSGRWVFLAPGADGLSWGDGHPVQMGLFRELV